MGAVTADRPERPKDDHYCTPPEATRALLSVEKFGGGIWECCAGTGEMAAVLRQAGYKVRATTAGSGHRDTQPPHHFGVLGDHDVFEAESLEYPNVVTNPPYGKPTPDIAERIVCHILGLNPVKAAFFLNIKFLGSVRRKNGLFKDRPPSRVWVCADRVTMYPAGHDGPKGTTTETFAWFVWDVSHIGAPAIGWIEAGQFKQGEQS